MALADRVMGNALYFCLFCAVANETSLKLEIFCDKERRIKWLHINKHWKVSVIMDNLKDAQIVSGMENYGAINYNMKDYYPITIVLPKKRTLLGAVIRSYRYGKMGIYNCIIRC